MSIFAKFEEEVIDTLVRDTLTPELISSLKREGSFVSYEYTGYGYFLNVAHPRLPHIRTVCSQPTVLGASGDILAGFVIFIKDRELTFEGYPLSDNPLPPNFRELDVHITINHGAGDGA